MALVPVFCDNPACQTVWASAGVIGGNATSIRMTGNKVGPCPNCGGMGSVPDGVYNLVDDTLEIVSLASGGLSIDALQRLIGSVRRASTTNESAAAFKARVAAETPDLAPVVNVFMRQSSSSGSFQQQLVTFLTILTVILAYLQWRDPQEPEPAPSPLATPAQERPLRDADRELIAQQLLQRLRDRPARPSATDTPSATHRDQHVRLTDLATPVVGSVIIGHRFVDCVVTGPAVALVIRQNTFESCDFSGTPDEILWATPLSASGRVFGAVGLVSCTFERCRFDGIGLAGPPEFHEQLRRNWREPPG